MARKFIFLQNMVKYFLPYAHALYMLITGIWPLIHMESFIAVTGPKTDLWLVKMVGLLACAIGAGMLYSFITKQFYAPTLMFIVFSSMAFITVDIYYALIRTISFIYLADAIAEIVFVFSDVYLYNKLKTQT